MLELGMVNMKFERSKLRSNTFHISHLILHICPEA